WNIGAQRTLPGKLVLEVNYAANRSTHLPFIGTQNRNFIPTAVREQYTTAELRQQVPNPFYPLFVGPGAVVDQPTSVYAITDDQGNPEPIPLQDELRPYPQFPGSFNGYRRTVANSWYNALQVVFHRRAGHYLTL